MKLESQLVSLELSKQLKEAGYPQKGLFWWVHHYGIDSCESYKWTLFYQKDEDDKVNEHIVAPTCAELGKKLPAWLSNEEDTLTLTCDKSDKYWGIFYSGFKHKQFYYQEANTEADARAKIWLYLKKEKLI